MEASAAIEVAETHQVPALQLVEPLVAGASLQESRDRSVGPGGGKFISP